MRVISHTSCLARSRQLQSLHHMYNVPTEVHEVYTGRR